MIRPTPEQIEQFTRLRNTQIHNYLKSSLESVRDALEVTTDQQVIQTMQGEAKTVRAILKLIEGNSGKQAL